MNIPSKLFALISLLILSACTPDIPETKTPAPDYTRTYDLHISGGTIVDGSGKPSYRGDILVSGDKISFIGAVDASKIDTARTIEATGRIVSPGFIDAHSHGDPLLESNDFLRNFLRQGITTVVLGQDGESPAKLADGSDATLPSFRDWIDKVGQHGTGPNIATLVGHGTIRELSGAGASDTVTAAQQAKMEQLITEAMNAGAYGLNSGLEYVPGRYANAAELAGLAKAVGAQDGLISSHIRSEDDDLVQASVQELIDQAQYARVNITHIKVVYGKTRAQGEAVLKQIRDARAKGMIVTADVYPYLASFGNMSFLYPEWAKRESEFIDAAANRREEFEEFLRAKIIIRNGPGAILVSSGEYSGKTLQEISDITGERPEALIIDFGYRGPRTAHFIMTKTTQDVFITAADVSISSDGSPTMRHPRSFGSFPKVIEEYVVRDKTMSIELAIHKMTGLTAKTFGIQTRGLLKQGYGADILVIDLNNVKASTSWSDIYAQPTGFDYVIVNGKITDTSVKSKSPVFGRILLKHKAD